MGNDQLTKRSENVAFSTTFLPRGATFKLATAGCRSMRLATELSLSGAKCAWPSTISYDLQPPNSINSCSEVPLCTCQEAQVCLRSWKRRSSMPARCFALSHAASVLATDIV
jgi:hypothetical protein